jgi:ubiquitin-like protein Pup
MPEREQKRRTAPSREQQTAEEEEAAVSTEKGEKLKAEIDDLLDEIDEVLEDNAEEFVRNYVQKGGQ